MMGHIGDDAQNPGALCATVNKNTQWTPWNTNHHDCLILSRWVSMEENNCTIWKKRLLAEVRLYKRLQD
jgi:hypothetical protein